MNDIIERILDIIKEGLLIILAIFLLFQVVMFALYAAIWVANRLPSPKPSYNNIYQTSIYKTGG